VEKVGAVFGAAQELVAFTAQKTSIAVTACWSFRAAPVVVIYCQPLAFTCGQLADSARAFLELLGFGVFAWLELVGALDHQFVVVGFAGLGEDSMVGSAPRARVECIAECGDPFRYAVLAPFHRRFRSLFSSRIRLCSSILWTRWRTSSSSAHPISSSPRLRASDGLMERAGET
jgi:hypothetical protein